LLLLNFYKIINLELNRLRLKMRLAFSWSFAAARIIYLTIVILFKGVALFA
jgi:hypothetical protein